MAQHPNRRSASRRGRQIGLLAFGLLVSVFTGVCTVQIIQQVFFQRSTPPRWQRDCLAGIAELQRSVVQARRDLLLAEDDELAAVENFRKALLPSWGYRGELESACASVADKHALALVDDFRYAHEHFVRLEAARLATTQQELDIVLNLELRSSIVSDETKAETGK